LRIAIFIRCFKPCSGGLQKHTADLARALVARGHQVTVVTRAISTVPDYRKTFFFSEPESATEVDGVQVEVLRHSRYLNSLLWYCMKCIGRPAFMRLGVWIFNAIFARQCKALLKGVDVIHHVGQGSEMLGFTAGEVARRLRIPFLVQSAVHPGQWGDGDLDVMLYRRADLLLAHTEYEALWLRTSGMHQRIAVVGCGIDDGIPGNGSRFRAKHELVGPIVLFLGRKDDDKGYHLLREAMRAVWERRPETACVLMGPPGSIKDGKADLPPRGRMVEIDSASEDEKHDALAACDLLCVPSEGESFGLVYMEAGRYGKPVIGRRIPVLEELIGVTNAGLLVGRPSKAGNRVDVSAAELADAILQLICKPSVAAEIGENCRLVSGEFVWTKVAALFENAYVEALAHYNQGTA